MVQPRPLFRLFSNLVASRIRTRIVGVEGNDADHKIRECDTLQELRWHHLGWPCPNKSRLFSSTHKHWMVCSCVEKNGSKHGPTTQPYLLFALARSDLITATAHPTNFVCSRPRCASRPWRRPCSGTRRRTWTTRMTSGNGARWTQIMEPNATNGIAPNRTMKFPVKAL